LLDDGEEAKQRTGIITDTSKKKLKVKRPDLSKALWLMNTQYISDMTVPEHKGRSEKDWAKRKKEGEETDMGWRDPCEVQLESIERSFAAAQCAPIHDKNQDLHPVETMQVLPDFDRWPGSYVHFVYDEDPALDIKTLEGLDDAAKSAVLARSVVKPYSIASAGEGSVPEKFVALMLPAVPTAPAGTADNAEVEPIAPEEYQWIREYQYRLQQEKDASLGTMCFFFDHNEGTVRYVALNTKLGLSKRSKHAKGLTGRMEWRPSKVTVKRVTAEANEERRRKKARAMLEDPTAAAASEREEAAAAAAALAEEEGAVAKGEGVAMDYDVE